MKKDFNAMGHNISIHPTGGGTDTAVGDRQAQQATGGASTLTPDRLSKMQSTLQEYAKGKQNLETSIVENERWYKIRHGQYIRAKGASHETEVEPTSAWLFNSLANKHADAMDNFPEPNILPREANDEAEAKKLTGIVPVLLDRNEFEDTYSRAWWYKLKNGTVVYGAFWDPMLENGIGDISIKKIDLLNLFWQPGITDIQDSPMFFNVSAVPKERYPQIADSGSSFTLKEYEHDENIDTTNLLLCVDAYYKTYNADTMRTLLHYCQFIGDTVIYASEDDPDYAERGFYDHGKYPFVFDVLFPEEDMPTGFGYVNVMKDPQLYIDKIDQIIMTNALRAGKSRWFISGSGNINEDEFADWGNDFIHAAGGIDENSLREVTTKPLPGFVVNHKIAKIEELKETSGNRDFSQGGTASGVTAAAAISALQEAGSKLSRDMIKGSYRAYKSICYLVIEMVRQFYDEARCFRITGEQGTPEYTEYSNAGIQPQELAAAYPEQEPSYRMPVFDIAVKPQKSNPFSKAAQNDLALTLYKLGFFEPQRAEQSLAAMELMEFDGKQKVSQLIAQNGGMYATIQQLMGMMGAAPPGGGGASGADTGAGGGMADMATTGTDAATQDRAVRNATTPYAQRMADNAKPNANKQEGV